MTSNQQAPTQQTTTDVILNEELSAASGSSVVEVDVTEVSETEVAQSNPSEFEVYLSSLDENIACSNAESADIERITSNFNDALSTVEKLGRIKSSSVWDIISQYPRLVQPVCRVISCLPSTQVSVEQMFSHLKLVLRENRASMGNDVTDAIVFLRTNKLV